MSYQSKRANKQVPYVIGGILLVVAIGSMVSRGSRSDVVESIGEPVQPGTSLSRVVLSVPGMT
ncbi:MAG: hypothetical protein MUC92_06425 [Fimbriimonadaceae bacterium]|jgi:hypothetical protein|nr:hypothetical protein [Fimbriimonadaceae bacterium]